MNFNFFSIERSPSQQVLGILDNNIIGTPGQSMLYQHLHVRNKIFKIPNPYFVNLKKGDKIIGTCCFCERETFNNLKTIRAFYIRYFSFLNLFRKKPLRKKNLNHASQLRREIKELLNGKGLEKSVSEKFYHYAYVDPRNFRSVRLCEEFDFIPVRNFSIIIFNRIRPKASGRVYEISDEEQNNVLERLRVFYKNHTMYSEENLFSDRKYYVIRNLDGKITAGAQVNPDHWKILSLPSGKILLNVFSYLPYLKALISKNYRFLSVDGIFVEAGNEPDLQTLLESLLSKYKVNSLMMIADSNSELYKSIKKMDWGLVSKLNKEVSGQVICRFNNFSEEEKLIFKTSCAYISPIDVT